MQKNNKPNQPIAQQMWGGRFTEAPSTSVQSFTASIEFDQQLYQQDIQVSQAHAKMLAKIGVLDEQECKQIITGLDAVKQDIESGALQWSVELEDVHMNIEAALTKKIGELGKKLHTGRSRNDLVATDLRLYVRDAIDHLNSIITQLQTNLLTLAEQEADSIMPGFTHLQVAQPITFGHHMMAWLSMIERDYQRLIDCRKRVNILPLGAAALAGTSFPIDQHYTAQLLGFDQVTDNSLDAVSDRDFAIEFNAALSTIMIHLSRWCEELIIWVTTQFSFIDIADRFCTGSSIMPQKKNPDIPELIRGKSGRVIGHLMGLLTLMKSQPLAYNKDNQEDKEPLFDSYHTARDCLTLFSDMLSSLSINRNNMLAATEQGFITATDLADYLVRKGVPFRDSHAIVGKIVQHAVTQDKTLPQLDLNELQQYSSVIEKDVYEILTVEGSVNARNHQGGTAPKQVRLAIEKANKHIASRSLNTTK